MSNSHALKLAEVEYIATMRDLLRQYPELAEDEQALLDSLEGETRLHESIAAVMRARAERLALADALKARMAEMKARCDRLLDGGEKLREVCADVMGRCGVKKVVADDMTISLQAGRPKVLVTDQEALPVDMTRTKVIVEADKTKIGEALAEGRAVPGACLSNAQPVLSVRVK